jgi:predicted enzyme related to lactoylglutathione lyase
LASVPADLVGVRWRYKDTAAQRWEVSVMTSPVIHFEIGGRDLGRMTSFYGELFGWRMQPAGPEYSLVPAPTDVPGVGQFAMFSDPDGNVVGLMHQDES